MTTTIPSTLTRRNVSLTHGDDGKVAVRISSQRHEESMVVNVKTSDLLDAVRSELGVLIIDKADLPEVTAEGSRFRVGDTSWPDALARRTVSAIRRDALENLALAEYLEAHPPVDEQQVEALVTLLGEFDVYRSQNASIIARTLIRTGKVRVQS